MKIAQAMADSDYMLTHHLHRHLTETRPHRGLDPHASDLADGDSVFCPREWALHWKAQTPMPPQKVHAARGAAFGISRDMADTVIGWFADSGRAFGDWSCMHCGAVHTMTLAPGQCRSCKVEDPLVRYREFSISVYHVGYICSIDLLYYRGPDRLVIPVEIKTLHKDDFKAVRGVAWKHRLRTRMYLRALDGAGHSNIVDTQRAKVLYVAKGGFGVKNSRAAVGEHDREGWTPFKEYWVERKDSEIEDLAAGAVALRDFKRGRAPLPGRVACPTSRCNRARACMMAPRCFTDDPLRGL